MTTTRADRPVALRVIDVVLSRLKEIKHENQYHTDAGNYIRFGDQAMDRLEQHGEGIAVFAGTETPQGDDGLAKTERCSLTMTIEVQGHTCAKPEETGRRLELLKADIKRALFRGRTPAVGSMGRERWPGQERFADSDGDIGGFLEYSGSQPFQREPGARVEAIVVTAIAHWIEKFGDPYESLGQDKRI
jgi:hypothetical protein